MAGEKRFGTSLFGFKKSDVNAYIEKLVIEMNKKIEDKNIELKHLKTQNEELQEKYNKLSLNESEVNLNRSKIADVLITAQEKAENLIKEAQEKAVKEKERLDSMLESEKERIVDIKNELVTLKKEVASKLKMFDEQLTGVIGDFGDENIALQEVAATQDISEETVQNSGVQEETDLPQA